MRRLVVLAALLAACGGGGSATPDAGGPAWLSDTKILVDGVSSTESDCRTKICPHNENTDLIVWNGAIYLVHRTAESQVLGPNSSLLIYKSTDGGVTFTQLARTPAPIDRDIRDPHFYVVGSELWVKTLTRLPVTSVRDSNVDTIAMGMHSSDGVTWSPLVAIGPEMWSYWRIKEHAGTLYNAAYHDGDTSVALYTSTDGATWTEGPDIYTVSADTPLETELQFMPSGKLLALVRMDGTDDELLGSQGRLRTKICWADPPAYASFTCPSEFDDQRLDGPVSFLWHDRLFVVARKHILGVDNRKRTSLFEITGTLDGGPLSIVNLGDFPSAGDTAYAGVAPIDDHRMLVTWYSSYIPGDDPWARAILEASDIWQGTIDLSKI